ncbi:MAG: small multi-drug export protein [Thermoplasmatota archaeon]
MLQQPRSASIQIVGLCLAAAALALLGLAYTIEPRWSGGLLAAMAAELVTGREAAIPLALAVGVPPAWIALMSILQNLALAALLVPLGVRSMQSIEGHPGFSARFLRGMQAAATRNMSRGRSSGALFVFMLVPFIANGPVLAGLIGVLAGMEMRRLIVVVVAAVVLTATAWSFGYAWLAAALANVHPALELLPAAGAATVLVLWIGAATYRALRQARPMHEDS